MGRGRAKAKQTKVARELKYSSPNTDLTSLQRELAGGSVPGSSSGRSSPGRDVAASGDGLDEVDDSSEDEDYSGWTGTSRR
jgi:Protein of unknown function (DUF3073)